MNREALVLELARSYAAAATDEFVGDDDGAQKAQTDWRRRNADQAGGRWIETLARPYSP